MKLAISKFRGLDVRRLLEASDPRTARVATNVDLTQGGEFETREPTEELLTLNPQSVGLYVLNGTLRACAPAGRSIPFQQVGPVPVTYDMIGAGNSSYASVTVTLTNSDQVVLAGAAWPAWAVGAVLTVGSYVATVLSVTGDTATMDTAFSGSPGSYAFTLVEAPNSLASRTVALTKDSNVLTLTNGVWPLNITGARLTLLGVNFSTVVQARNSDTELIMVDTYTGANASGQVFVVSGLADAYPLDQLVRVSAVESVGASAQFGVYPYLVVERWIDPADHSRGTMFEHHWIRQTPASTTTAVATQVTLPFSPGASLVKASGKLWAVDDVNGVVRFSSTANGPTDWTTAEDAGYIPVLTHASGDRRARGLGIYDDKLAVIFADAVQLWATDPQPTNITLVRVANGPGTTQPRSVVNVLGDLFYLTRGGFRSLHTAVVTGQIQEQDDIGTPIDDLVQLETASADAALWSQTRGQYLCAIGSRVYAFRYSPKSKIMGWTTWELPFTVAAMVELNGVLYFRSTDNKLHRMRAGARESVTYTVRLNDTGAQDPTRRKRFDFIEVLQRGSCSLKFYLEPEDDSIYTTGPDIDGSTIAQEPIFMGVMSRTVGIQFSGQGPWLLSSVHLTYLNLGF